MHRKRVLLAIMWTGYQVTSPVTFHIISNFFFPLCVVDKFLKKMINFLIVCADTLLVYFNNTGLHLETKPK
jgi:hypothetical protein